MVQKIIFKSEDDYTPSHIILSIRIDAEINKASLVTYVNEFLNKKYDGMIFIKIINDDYMTYEFSIEELDRIYKNKFYRLGTDDDRYDISHEDKNYWDIFPICAELIDDETDISITEINKQY